MVAVQRRQRSGQEGAAPALAAATTSGLLSHLASAGSGKGSCFVRAQAEVPGSVSAGVTARSTRRAVGGDRVRALRHALYRAAKVRAPSLGFSESYIHPTSYVPLPSIVLRASWLYGLPRHVDQLTTLPCSCSINSHGPL
jgi:hypothetical protein